MTSEKIYSKNRKMNSDYNLASTLTSLTSNFQEHILLPQKSLPSLLRKLYIAFKRGKRVEGAPKWRSPLNVWLLILAQVTISGSWNWVLCQAMQWAWNLLKMILFFSLPLSLDPPCSLKKNKCWCWYTLRYLITKHTSHSAMKGNSREQRPA